MRGNIDLLLGEERAINVNVLAVANASHNPDVVATHHFGIWGEESVLKGGE